MQIRFTEADTEQILAAEPAPTLSGKAVIGWTALRRLSRQLQDENRSLKGEVKGLNEQKKRLETRCAILAITVEDLKKSLREMTEAQSAFLEEIRA